MSILSSVRYDVLYRAVLKLVWFIFSRRYHIYSTRYDGEPEAVFETLLNVATRSFYSDLCFIKYQHHQTPIILSILFKSVVLEEVSNDNSHL